QETLTNESIVAMLKGGLSEAVVLARIRSGPANFDTSTNSLLALKKAGVSDKVIEAMVSAPKSAPAAAAAPAPAPAAAPAGAPPAGVPPGPVRVRVGEEQRRRPPRHAPARLDLSPERGEVHRAPAPGHRDRDEHRLLLPEERGRARRTEGGVSHHRQAAAVLQLLRADRGAPREDQAGGQQERPQPQDG